MRPGNGKNWHTSEVNEFWSKTASQHNVFHVYENENRFIDLLTGFVGTGVNSNECSVVIASNDHLTELHKDLELHGIQVTRLIEDGRYYPVDADTLLEKIMIDNTADENLFFQCITNLIKTAKRGHQKIRIYREMVAILQEKGNVQARRTLEIFWSKFSEIQQVLIFCAYPQKGFNGEECSSLRELGFVNPKVIQPAKSKTHVLYANCNS